MSTPQGADDRPITVEVHFEDAQHVFELPRSARVTELQKQIADTTGVPVREQKLIGFMVDRDSFEGLRISHVTSTTEDIARIMLLRNPQAQQDMDAAPQDDEETQQDTATQAEAAHGGMDAASSLYESSFDDALQQHMRAAGMMPDAVRAMLDRTPHSMASSTNGEGEGADMGYEAVIARYLQTRHPQHREHERERQQELEQQAGLHAQAEADADLDTSIIAADHVDDAYEGDPLLPSGDFEVGDFVQAFQTKHPLTPLFVQESFTQALRECSDSALPLLLYLHDDRSPHNARFADMVCDPAVVSVASSYFVAFGYDFTHSAARKRLLEEANPTVRLGDALTGDFPCVAVLARVGGLFQMTKCFTAEAFDTAADLAAALEMEGVLVMSQTMDESGLSSAEADADLGLDAGATSPAAARRRGRRVRTETEQLREEQDEAYQRSLEADRRKEKEKEEQEEQRRREEETNAQFEQAREEMQEALAQQVQDEPPQGEDCVLVRIRTPEGKNVTRRFHLDTSIGQLETYAGSLGYLPTTHRLRFPPRSKVPEDDKSVAVVDCFPSKRVSINVEAI